jgi:hypothetical protein
MPSVSTASPTVIRFDELYLRQGVFPPALEALANKQVTMNGFMAPPLKIDSDFFVLTKLPMASCPFCGSEEDWPDDIVVVKTAGRFTPIDFNLVIGVQGRLELGSQTDQATGFLSRIRIVDARFWRIRR